MSDTESSQLNKLNDDSENKTYLHNKSWKITKKGRSSEALVVNRKGSLRKRKVETAGTPKRKAPPDIFDVLTPFAESKRVKTLSCHRVDGGANISTKMLVKNRLIVDALSAKPASENKLEAEKKEFCLDEKQKKFYVNSSQSDDSLSEVRRLDERKEVRPKPDTPREVVHRTSPMEKSDGPSGFKLRKSIKLYGDSSRDASEVDSNQRENNLSEVNKLDKGPDPESPREAVHRTSSLERSDGPSGFKLRKSINRRLFHDSSTEACEKNVNPFQLLEYSSSEGTISQGGDKNIPDDQQYCREKCTHMMMNIVSAVPQNKVIVKNGSSSGEETKSASTFQSPRWKEVNSPVFTRYKPKKKKKKDSKLVPEDTRVQPKNFEEKRQSKNLQEAATGNLPVSFRCQTRKRECDIAKVTKKLFASENTQQEDSAKPLRLSKNETYDSFIKSKCTPIEKSPVFTTVHSFKRKKRNKQPRLESCSEDNKTMDTEKPDNSKKIFQISSIKKDFFENSQEMTVENSPVFLRHQLSKLSRQKGKSVKATKTETEGKPIVKNSFIHISNETDFPINVKQVKKSPVFARCQYENMTGNALDCLPENEQVPAVQLAKSEERKNQQYSFKEASFEKNPVFSRPSKRKLNPVKIAKKLFDSNETSLIENKDLKYINESDGLQLNDTFIEKSPVFKIHQSNRTKMRKRPKAPEKKSGNVSSRVPEVYESLSISIETTPKKSFIREHATRKVTHLQAHLPPENWCLEQQTSILQKSPIFSRHHRKKLKKKTVKPQSDGLLSLEAKVKSTLAEVDLKNVVTPEKELKEPTSICSPVFLRHPIRRKCTKLPSKLNMTDVSPGNNLKCTATVNVGNDIKSSPVCESKQNNMDPCNDLSTVDQDFPDNEKLKRRITTEEEENKCLDRRLDNVSNNIMAEASSESQNIEEHCSGNLSSDAGVKDHLQDKVFVNPLTAIQPSIISYKKKKAPQKGSLQALYDQMMKDVESERRLRSYERRQNGDLLPGAKEFRVLDVWGEIPVRALVQDIRDNNKKALLLFDEDSLDDNQTITPGSTVFINPPWEFIEGDDEEMPVYIIYMTCEVVKIEESVTTEQSSCPILEDVAVEPFLQDSHLFISAILNL